MYDKYMIKRIDEADFGCEGRPDGYVPTVKVFLEGEYGAEVVVEMEDAKMYERELDEGVEVIIGDDATLYQANTYMEFVETDNGDIVQENMTDKQSEWLDGYMDAIEEMEG